MTTSTNKPQTSDSIPQTKTGKTKKPNKTTRVSKQQAVKQPKQIKQTKRTKKQIALELLKRSQGASLAEIQKALGWKIHSVRGFLAGTAKKEQGFLLHSEKPDSQLRRYRLTAVESS